MRRIAVAVLGLAAVLAVIWTQWKRADTFVAGSIFGGTVTQAPAGNILGVTANVNRVTGVIRYPVNPIKSGTVSSFEIRFGIGSALYMANVTTDTTITGTITLTNNVITAIDIAFPQSPVLPALVLNGMSFFAAAGSPSTTLIPICGTGQVCGTLDFTNSTPFAEKRAEKGDAAHQVPEQAAALAGAPQVLQ